MVERAELARRVNVDGRTLRRYIARLEELGIPVQAERGRYGCYSLMPGFKLPPMMFSNAEAVALSLGLLAARERRPGAGSALNGGARYGAMRPRRRPQ